jgi:uncharacterized membrane protein YqaE (UPF0057 family)
MIASLLLIILTIFSTSLPYPHRSLLTPHPTVPPLGVFIVADCGPDVIINILLTLLGFLPGHIHAFYVEYIYFTRRDDVRDGIYNAWPAPGVYSQKVQNGGQRGVQASIPAAQ